ncbi:MAG: cysteine--tRNA ligase [Verrucomicrobia bacterium]|jgi:cysteinyl-tRNA synthetase|nr:cysteine--tRNA ligase [Verrucomicrobiota bacterium]
MHVYNTESRRLDEVVPLEEGHIRLYTCGPTVYNAAHIGNFRTYVFEDLLRRYLKYCGFRVTQVMNLTDVDDKTIRGAKAAGKPLREYTQIYKDMFFEDIKTLNIEPAEHYPAATDHIDEVIAIIEKLFEKGLAYKSEDGSVYFSIAKFPNYGRLARIDTSALQSGARVAQDEYEKENASDFALWKAWTEEDGDVVWESPWGRGRPGWHIECSAMSMKYLGESFDIHTGGVDNMFPHHDDEIAQSEGATGKTFVKYWMHSAHLVVDGKKMSKSLGNFHTLREVMERGYQGREVRYVLLAAHYRQSLNFTFEAVESARASLSRLDEFSDRLRECKTSGAALPAWAETAKTSFETALNEDLNIAEALASLFDMVHAGNRAMDAGEMDWSAGAVLELMKSFDSVLGILEKPAAEVDADAQALLEARAKARADKDWAESDRIRDALSELGWEVRDSAEGQKLKKKG